MNELDNIESPLRELALFAGAGGGILGGKLLGWRTVCAVEWEPYPAAVLCARQNDGFLEDFPIWDDVQTFDGRPWRGLVDVVSGGFPCQDISSAGKGAGIDGERSGMWKHMARIIGEVRPRFAFVENSPMLTTRGLDRVITDLAEMGYNAKWGIVSAADAGAPHLRERIWIRAELANACKIRRDAGRPWESLQGPGMDGKTKQMADADGERLGQGDDQDARWPAESAVSSNKILYNNEKRLLCQKEIQKLERRRHSISNNRNDRKTEWWATDPGDEPESGVVRMVNGLAFGVHRLKAIGNGQVPMAAKLAWELLA